MAPLLIAILPFLAATAASAQEEAASTQEMVCPVGGQSFEFERKAAGQPVGERPDGKPFGAKFPLSLPECPDNGLVFYKDYDAEEAAKLEALVNSGEYQSLRGETQYYRAYWLMKQMDVAPERYLIALLQAGWEAEAKPETRIRYLTELAEASAAVEPKPEDINWIGMEGRAINALRELGRFDEALARLDKVPAAALEASNEPAKRRWAAYFGNLRLLIERRDASAEPLEMIPRAIALARCVEQRASLPDQARAFCEKEATAVAALRTKRQNEAQVIEALKKPREESGR